MVSRISLILLLIGALTLVSGQDERHELQKRIVGGQEVQPPFKYDFMLRLVVGSAPTCGASLIDPYWALTAAHCVEFLTPFQCQFEHRRHNLTWTAEQEGARVLSVEYIAVHPNLFYQEILADNDIALVRLSEPVLDADLILLDRDGSYSVTGILSTVIGWGRLVFEGPRPDVLQEVQVPIVSQVQCAEAYPEVLESPSNLCAGFPEGLKDACNGDSGGPLFVEESGKTYQAGIVSSGRGCAEPNGYGTYARISNLINFVDKIMNGYVSDPCETNPCMNGGVCNAYSNKEEYEPKCICPVTHKGKLCETPICDSPNCFVYGEILNATVPAESVYEHTIEVSGLPNPYPANHVRFLTSTVERYSDYDITITTPNGDEIVLHYYFPYDFNCFTSVSWDFYAASNETACPATNLLPASEPISFYGQNLNGKWTIRIENERPYPHINVLSWGIRVDIPTPCSSCLNGGTCLNFFDEDNCYCPGTIEGEFCEGNPCNPSPCNNGECSIVNNLAKCSCISGYGGRFCDKLSCPQGCLFGSCSPGETCSCNLNWDGPSCSTPKEASLDAFCFDDEEGIFTGQPVSEMLMDIESAVSISSTRDCAIETVSGGNSIVDVGYTVSDGIFSYCCRGKGKIGTTGASPNLVCTSQNCDGESVAAGPGSASFSLNPASEGDSCYHSCVSADGPPSSCSSELLFKGTIVGMTSLRKRSLGDAEFYVNTPSKRKNCLIDSSNGIQSGYVIQIADGSQFCCSKGIYDSSDETCRNGCGLNNQLEGLPFVSSSAVDGDNCYAACYSLI